MVTHDKAKTEPHGNANGNLKGKRPEVTYFATSRSNTIREVDLNNAERKLLLAVETADVTTVQEIMDNAVQLKVNINCVDPWGRTALIVAIENDNLEIMNLLLRYHVALGDALLHAVNHDHVDAVSMILQYEASNISHHKNIQKYFGESPSQTFSHEITPLMLACHRDNYPIVRLLIERGDTLDVPHALSCTCKRCVRANHENSIRHSKERYNTYKALTSPSLICLTSKDPILTAFELAIELNNLSKCESEYSKQYQELATELHDFSCGLLDQTRSFTELTTILNHSAGAPNQENLMKELTERSHDFDSLDGQRGKLTRLKLAIDYGEKAFVAHSHCQQMLSSIWLEGLDDLREKSMIGTLIVAVTYAVLFPFFATSYLLAPHSKFGRKMQLPFVKFVCQTCSYLFFILLIVVDAMRIEQIIRGNNPLDQSHVTAPGVIECGILLYVIGFLVHDVKCIYRNGFRDFIGRAYNMVSFAMIAFYFCVFGLRISAYVEVSQLERENIAVNENRVDWFPYDPIIVSEGLLACASILSVLRFTEVFTMLRGLGPLMISIGNIINDIFLFLVVYFLVIFAFAIGFQQLLWFYGYMWYNELCMNNNIANISSHESPAYGPHSTRCLTQGSNWNNLFNIFQSLYWGIFGLVYNTDLLNGYHHVFEQLLTELVFGIYMFAAWPLLLNLLIALIIHTYSNVRVQEDIEWKFARASLFIRYFSADETLPIPFNIFPSMKFVTKSINKIKKSFDRAALHGQDRVERRLESVRHRINVVTERQEHYENIMNQIIQRYLVKRYKDIRDALVNIDDITELKQDVVMFRQDLLNILQYNGLDVPKAFRKRATRVRKKKQPAVSYYQAKLA